MGVQGVGAKVALAIQGVLSPGDLVQAVAAEDKAMVARAPGVGPKVAQRIVQELKDKIPEAAFGVAVSADAGGPHHRPILMPCRADQFGISARRGASPCRRQLRHLRVMRARVLKR